MPDTCIGLFYMCDTQPTTDDNLMRLFTSLELSSKDKTKLFHWRERNLSAHLGAIPEKNFHITLCFFGEVADKNACQLVSDIEAANAVTHLKPFTLSLDQLSFWPKTGIIWIGPSECPDALGRLANKHQSIAAKLGVKKAKHNYQAHVSLVRDASAFVKPLQSEAINVDISAICLYESHSKNFSTPQYSVVERWPLLPY